MGISHTFWNIRELARWLRQEISCRGSLEEFAGDLGVDVPVLLVWLAFSYQECASITADQASKISQYRGWPLEETMVWLDVSPSLLFDARSPALD